MKGSASDEAIVAPRLSHLREWCDPANSGLLGRRNDIELFAIGLAQTPLKAHRIVELQGRPCRCPVRAHQRGNAGTRLDRVRSPSQRKAPG
jgi:hypothetical protein